MPKRFTATEIWSEDWFLNMPNEYKLFWYYMLSECDHSGLFRVNLRSFCGLLEVKINSDDALRYFNEGKDRIRVINQSVWYIEDFFVFQYGHNFNMNNPLHRGVEKLYKKFDIELTSIRGVKDLSLGVKEKDKVEDINKEVKQKNNGHEKFENFAAQGEKLLATRLQRSKLAAERSRKSDTEK